MAAIGDGWATDAWIEASWVTGACLVGDLVLRVLRPFRALEIAVVGAIGGSRLYFNLEPSIAADDSGTRRQRQIKSLIRSRKRR